jgi:hypothetical protein
LDAFFYVSINKRFLQPVFLAPLVLFQIVNITIDLGQLGRFSNTHHKSPIIKMFLGHRHIRGLCRTIPFALKNRTMAEERNVSNALQNATLKTASLRQRPVPF